MDIITKKEGKIAVQQKVREGERILVAPLYIRTKPSCTEDALQDDTCSSPLHPCLTHDKSKLLLCPLGTASSLKYSPTESNARYSWGQWNEFNFEANGRRNADEILNHHSNGMTLDVIASRDIDVGEEIVVASGAPNQMGIEALDGIYRLEWREQEETEAAM